MLEHIHSIGSGVYPLSAPAAPSPLVTYLLRGLDSCWMPEHGRWSQNYHLDGRMRPNRSIPHCDVFHTLSTLLGLSRIRHFGQIHQYDPKKIFDENVVLVPRLPSPKCAYGVALWASAQLGSDIPADTYDRIRRVMEDRAGWMKFSAQDLAMALIGCVEQARRGRTELAATARALFHHLDRYHSCRSDLFHDRPAGWRRRFSSFASQCYLTLACYIYGEWARDQRALNLAKRCSARLISLQGPQGEWPWALYTPSGRILDYYEIHTVHQAGLAPAILDLAEQHGVAGADEALIRGFQWIYGENQLRKSMLSKKQGLIVRSQMRLCDSRRDKVMRAGVNLLTGGGRKLAHPAGVELRMECCSSHLGWILWAFGQRDDLPEIQHHPALG
jgi:hypothetical protein